MPTPAQQMLEASYSGDTATVAELLELDRQLADLAERSNDRYSVLHIASKLGYVEIVELLLVAGASVDRYSHHGEVPLMVAAQMGHLEVAKILIAAGADSTLTENGGHTILDAAMLSNNPEMISLIRGLPQPDQTTIHARGYLNGRKRVT